MFCLLWPILAIPFKLVVGVERGALNCDDQRKSGEAGQRERERGGGGKQEVIDRTPLHLREYQTMLCNE